MEEPSGAESLDSNVDPWDLYKTLQAASESANLRWRSRIVMYFAVYAFLELLAAASVQEITLVGVKINSVEALLTVTPLALALILYESVEAMFRSWLLSDALFDAGEAVRGIGGNARAGLAGAGPGDIARVISSHTADTSDAYMPRTRRVFATFSLAIAYFARVMVIPTAQILAISRAVAILIDRYGQNWWIWLQVVVVCVIVAGAIGIYVTFLSNV